MKTIKVKTLLMLLSGIILSYPLQAQTFEKEIQNDASFKIEILISHSDVRIESYSGNKIVVQNLNYEGQPDKAEGLRNLYTLSEDNTGVGLAYEQEEKLIRLYPAARNIGDLLIRIPDKAGLKIEEVNWGGMELNLSGHRGEIEIKMNSGDMNLENITGPLVLSSTSGDLKIDFSSLQQIKPNAISLVSGDIDILIPEDAKVSFIINTVSGDVYTNLDMKIDRKDNNMKNQRRGNQNWNQNDFNQGTVTAQLNSGGVQLSINSVSGNIYLRKK